MQIQSESEAETFDFQQISTILRSFDLFVAMANTNGTAGHP